MRGRWLGIAVAFGMIASAGAASAEPETRADDYFQILQTSSKYAWGIDTLDRQLLSTVFAPNAHAHYEIVNDSPIKLNEDLSGFGAIFSFLQRNLGHRKGLGALPWHFVSNQVIEMHGDQADMRFYMHNRPGAAGGVYHMHLVRTPQGWRVDDLRLDEQIWNAGAYAHTNVDK